MSGVKTIWPLNISSFSFWDKLKISKFILTDDRWTQGEFVRKYEEKWEKYTGANHAIMVSSGSAANELIALKRKDELIKSGQWPQRNGVIFPAVTWISSISPWVNLGFEPIFMDVTGATLNSTFEDVEIVLKRNLPKVGTLFYTSLLGFCEDVVAIGGLCVQHDVSFLMDNCESSFSHLHTPWKENSHTHICAFTTCSTSVYFSHLTTTGTEGGFIFCRTEEDRDWYRMARSHGMTRGMPDKYKNPNVDPMFDFYLMGSNYRSSNLAAYMGLLDFDKALEFSTDIDSANSRIRLSNYFMESLGDKFLKPHLQKFDDYVPLALPVVLKKDTKPNLVKIMRKVLEKAKIESRPLISGNLLRQTAFQKYGNPEDFPGAEFLHYNAFYVGLHKNVTKAKLDTLSWGLNLIANEDLEFKFNSE